jgi:hypothetical protein
MKLSLKLLLSELKLLLVNFSDIALLSSRVFPTTY